ncbi:uncharacterized protein PHACADRAFT_254596 [Phanerochaete carnosa HHB-10118-sp]|uniref:F-box domain-containing protein n=1 Tax=Phanerochaete carnosa (strain HHB-10118-sp) TaxID=650164 RepID=K5WDG0_PHACS|nr:uncharacterized protein PHACADRAFT_254596 [Phanerochaete carnosa HHB-10118-sp]EKM57064.1 hypothetical protein PHACADRAFT_254596 [Phanerochaete carnosa HHB-10118-sp]
MALFSRPLPVDIVAMIVDYFEGDREALCNMSLVAKAWVYPARVYLFRLMWILISQEHDGLAEFRHFLDTPRGQRHAGHIVGLCVRGVEPGDESCWEPTVDLFALGEVVGQLSKLENFEADRVRFSGVPLHGPLPPIAPKVLDLSFARMTTWVYDDLKDCLDVLHLFPNVKQIMTDDLLRPVKETGVRYDGMLPTKYRKFEHLRLEDLHHLAYGPASPLLHYMLHSMDLRNFTTLSLFHLSLEEIPYLGEFVHAVKDTLRYLYFKTTNIQFILDEERECIPSSYPENIDRFAV